MTAPGWMMAHQLNIGRALRRLALAVALLSLPGAALAQTSADYRLREHAINAGGRPADAVVSISPSFRLSLDSIGEPLARRGLSGPSFRLDGGFTPAYGPPGEVAGVQILSDGQTLTWSPEPTSMTYNLYSGTLSTLPGTFGSCAQSQVAATTLVEASMPPPGSGLFFIITGENRLGEEGIKGRSTGDSLRSNPAPCP